MWSRYYLMICKAHPVLKVLALYLGVFLNPLYRLEAKVIEPIFILSFKGTILLFLRLLFQSMYRANLKAYFTLRWSLRPLSIPMSLSMSMIWATSLLRILLARLVQLLSLFITLGVTDDRTVDKSFVHEYRFLVWLIL